MTQVKYWILIPNVVWTLLLAYLLFGGILFSLPALQ
jgi:hypothetical protein